MTTRTIPRVALGAYLRVVRAPFDGLVALLPGDGASLALDRTEATIRALAGMALGDAQLVEDAQRRRVAADERERAIRLHAEAERRTDAEDERLAERREDAERRREQAAEQANARRRRARKSEQQTRSRAGEAERKRRAAARKTAQQADETIDERERRARLETLDTKAEALDEHDDAMTAEDEARRLAEAAAAAKAERKATGTA